MKNKFLKLGVVAIISCAVFVSGCAGVQKQVSSDTESVGSVIQTSVKSGVDEKEDKGPFYLLTQSVVSALDESMIPEDISPTDGNYVTANRCHPIGDFAYTFWDRKVTGTTLCEMYHNLIVFVT